MNGSVSTGYTPRVSGYMIPNYLGKSVVLLGHAREVDQNGMSFTLMSCDNKPVKVIMNEPLNEYVAGLTEVHGTVDQRGHIVCDNYILFSNDASQSFDAALYGKAVDLMHKHPEHYITGVDHE